MTNALSASRKRWPRGPSWVLATILGVGALTAGAVIMPDRAVAGFPLCAGLHPPDALSGCGAKGTWWFPHCSTNVIMWLKPDNRPSSGSMPHTTWVIIPSGVIKQNYFTVSSQIVSYCGGGLTASWLLLGNNDAAHGWVSRSLLDPV